MIQLNLMQKERTMKKTKKLKSKIMMSMLALAMPLAATGVAFTAQSADEAKAAEASSTVHTGYMKEVSLSNNNFNSSSNYSISTSLSGWSGLNNTEKKTTAGIINVGNSFQNYMSGTYRLAKNPLAKATDKNILMINSKTADSSNYETARQGYRSNTISLEANSFYSFQVSFKNDTNYNSYTSYVEKNKVTEETTLDKTKFEAKGFDEYIAFTYKSKQYYLHKTLTSTSTTVGTEIIDFAKSNVFYEDETYRGIILNDNAVFVKVADMTTQADEKYTIAATAEIFVCENISYDKDSSKYKIAANTKYYTTKTEYSSLNDYVYGSMYLSGLKDANGKLIDAKFEKVSSKDWTTFYFFVATGAESQSVTLDLWLGANKHGHESSGVAFFDDVHVYQYSQNTFWKTYKGYMNKSYVQEVTSGGRTEEVETQCSQLFDLTDNKTLAYPSHNFDFEAGIYNDNTTSLKNWKKSGNGQARIFDTRDAEFFKQQTGHAFVGSTLSCKVTIDGETVDIAPNNYVLALWGTNKTVKVTSNDVAIDANEIYKIKAYYKTSDLESGKAYMYVKENDNVLLAYNLTSDDYTLKEETASSALSSEGSDEFKNNYESVEFFVKGGALYNSSINISLALGNGEENATGCVVFDDITIEKATTDEFSNATNKVELDSVSDSLTVPNGNFNKVTITDQNHPYAPANWTLAGSENGIKFAGVINTEAATYAKYKAEYERLKAEGLENHENPYFWATTANPLDSYGSSNTPDNIMMFANMTQSSQSMMSEQLSLEANKTYRLTFNFKTTNSTPIKVSVVDDNNITLFEADNITSGGAWDLYEIYFKSYMNASKVQIKVEFETTEDAPQSYAYFDNFEFKSVVESIYNEKAQIAEGNEDDFGVVDMTNFYLNIPSNKESANHEINSPAYSGTPSSGEAISGGIYETTKFENQTSKFYIENADKKTPVFFIQSQNKGSYYIESNFKIDLASGSYYALSFKIKTYFEGTLDPEKEYEYGASVGLSGFEYLKNLKTSGNDYETYTIYINPSEAASANLYISLICDAEETKGAVAIYDLKLEESDEETFNMIKDKTEADDFNLSKEKVFISTADGEDPSDEPSDEEEKTPTSSNIDWSIFAASAITGLAIIVAVIGYFLSKIKIKKIEKKRKESYDRKSSLNMDVIKNKARKQKDEEIAKTKENLAKFEKELESLEKAHKQKVLEQRLKDQGKVSKETDKEFKLFAQKRTVVAEKIESLKKKLEELNSPEYLLNLERKVYAQDEQKKRELIRESKKLNKSSKK